MKILIIGGTGFIGAHLASALSFLGHKVAVICRANDDCRQKKTIDIYRGDRQDTRWLRKSARNIKADIVYDLAGFSAKDAGAAFKIFNKKIKQYIYLSSVFVYQHYNSCFLRKNAGKRGINYFNIPITEKHPCHPAKNYGKQKLASEKFLLKKFREEKFPVTILRSPPVFGPLKDKTNISSYIKKIMEADFDERRELYYISRILRGKNILLPNGGYNLIHNIYVKELVCYLIRVMGKTGSFGEVYNVASEEPIMLRDYVGLLGEGMNKKIKIINLQEKTTDAVSASADFYLKFPYAYPFHVVIDARKIKKLLGMEKTAYGLAPSIESTAKWWTKREAIKKIDFSLPPKK